MASSLGFGSLANNIRQLAECAFNTCFRYVFGAELLKLSYLLELVGSFCKKHAITPRSARWSRWVRRFTPWVNE